MCETRRRERAPVGQPALPLLGAVRAWLGALLLRQPRRRDRGVRGERAGRRAPGRGHHAIGGWRPGLGAGGLVVRVRRARAGARADDEARGRPRARAGGAMLQLGEPRAGASWRSAGRRRPSICASEAEKHLRRARPASARGDRGRVRGPRSCSPRATPPARPRRPGCRPRSSTRSARRSRRRSRAVSRAARWPRPASEHEAIAALREAEQVFDAVRLGADRATRRAASCASWARAPRRAARRPPRTRGVGSLSKRELEIAELITDRLTNHEIAEQAVPQQEDGRVAHPQPVREAGRLVPRGGRAHRRARAA